MQIFPKLSELIYRIRNAAREIQTDPLHSSEDIKVLSDLLKDFEAHTYEFRLPLEQASVFSPIHQYKRHLQTFLLTAKEFASSFCDSREGEEGAQVRQVLDELYAEIDGLQQNISGELAVLVFSQTVRSKDE